MKHPPSLPRRPRRPRTSRRFRWGVFRSAGNVWKCLVDDGAKGRIRRRGCHHRIHENGNRCAGTGEWHNHVDSRQTRPDASRRRCRGYHKGDRMTETVAEIVAAHRSGKMSPRETVARSYARIREHGDPAIFITLRDEAEALAEADELSKKTLRNCAVRLTGRGERQYRCRGSADHGGVSGILLYARERRKSGAAPAVRRRHRDRQDQSRSDSPRASSVCVRLTAFRKIRSTPIWCRADQVRARQSRSPRA